MTISSRSYGSVADVAALTPRHADETATFSTATRPTLAQVETYINEVSAIINVLLSADGFAVPVTQADVKLVLDLFVNQEVASIVEGVNGAGRFGPSEKKAGTSRFTVTLKDVQDFIKGAAPGFVNLGATRTYSATEGIGSRGTDADGNAVVPLFQRENFGFQADTDDGEES